MIELKEVTQGGYTVKVMVDKDTGHFALVTTIIPAGEEYKHRHYPSLELAEKGARNLINRASVKVPKIGVEYFDTGTMEHWTVVKRRQNGHYSIKSRGAQTDVLKYLPTYDVLRPLSVEELGELRQLKDAVRLANGALETFKKPRQIRLTDLVRKREAVIEALLDKASVKQEVGCTCGEATLNRPPDTPKCSYCVTGVALEAK